MTREVKIRCSGFAKAVDEFICQRLDSRDADDLPAAYHTACKQAEAVTAKLRVSLLPVQHERVIELEEAWCARCAAIETEGYKLGFADGVKMMTAIRFHK